MRYYYIPVCAIRRASNKIMRAIQRCSSLQYSMYLYDRRNLSSICYIEQIKTPDFIKPCLGESQNTHPGLGLGLGRCWTLRYLRGGHGGGADFFCCIESQLRWDGGHVTKLCCTVMEDRAELCICPLSRSQL